MRQSIMIKQILFILLFVVALSVIGNPAMAQADLRELLEAFGDSAGISDTEIDEQGIVIVIGKFINFVLGFLAVIFLVLVVYAGFLWMTAGGNEDRVSKAKKIILRALIGLGIIILAYAFTWVVMMLLSDIAEYSRE